MVAVRSSRRTRSAAPRARRTLPRPMVGALTIAVALSCFGAAAGSAGAANPEALTGAIFTTLPNGEEVNANKYESKFDVYLDGGPGPGAPQEAAGLPDGTYVFQVTEPSGKTLLSEDPAKCRQFTVFKGIITEVVPAGGCQHKTGLDVDHGATTVQLMPYKDTPNNGGEYKAWATPLADYLKGCEELGVFNGLEVVDCGYKAGVAEHGFIPHRSKTDNYKVENSSEQEIDTSFINSKSERLDGKGVTWTAPDGASNRKWSYYSKSLNVNHEAHVEAVDSGTNLITVANQPGCTVSQIVSGNTVVHGPGTVAVKVTGTSKSFTLRVNVFCS
jgi:hypothetical protein